MVILTEVTSESSVVLMRGSLLMLRSFFIFVFSSGRAVVALASNWGGQSKTVGLGRREVVVGGRLGVVLDSLKGVQWRSESVERGGWERGRSGRSAGGPKL